MSEDMMLLHLLQIVVKWSRRYRLVGGALRQHGSVRPAVVSQHRLRFVGLSRGNLRPKTDNNAHHSGRTARSVAAKSEHMPPSGPGDKAGAARMTSQCLLTTQNFHTKTDTHSSRKILHILRSHSNQQTCCTGIRVCEVKKLDDCSALCIPSIKYGDITDIWDCWTTCDDALTGNGLSDEKFPTLDGAVVTDALLSTEVCPSTDPSMTGAPPCGFHSLG